MKYIRIFSFLMVMALCHLLTFGFGNGWPELNDPTTLHKLFGADFKVDYENGLSIGYQIYNDTECVISYIIAGSDSELVIPSTASNDGKNYTVVGIRRSAIEGNNYSEVTFPATMQYVENPFDHSSRIQKINVSQNSEYLSVIDNALYNKSGEILIATLPGIVNFEVPERVKMIGIGAFDTNSKLISVSLSASVDSICPNAFYNCSSLKEINVDSGNTHFVVEDGILYNFDKSILVRCFPGNVQKTVVEVPSSVIKLEDGAFNYCTKISSVSLPDNLEAISNYAFEYCADLRFVDVRAAIKSIGVRAFFTDSKLVEFEVPYSVNSIGDDAFELCKALRFMILPEELSIIGRDVFRNCTSLSYVVIPRSLSSIGRSVFEGCKNLAALIWNAEIKLSLVALSVVDNPNLLVYVNNADFAPTGHTNVIVQGHAKEIHLVDSDKYPFYCPEAFDVEYVSYTHSYTQATPIGGCEGWETLALPFPVQTMTHAEKGEIKPFAALAGNFGEYKPFWLFQMSGDSEFIPSDEIMPNIPYIISMPNNDKYPEEYILAGDVTFAARNSMVERTEQMISGNEILFVPSFGLLNKSDDVYALNVNQPYEDNPAGSVFVPGLSDVYVFQAYLTSEYRHNAPLRVADMIDGSQSLLPSTLLSDLKVYSHGDILYVSTKRALQVNVYTPTGALVRNLDLQPGTTTVDDLHPGIYIVANQKVIITR